MPGLRRGKGCWRTDIPKNKEFSVGIVIIIIFIIFLAALKAIHISETFQSLSFWQEKRANKFVTKPFETNYLS